MSESFDSRARLVIVRVALTGPTGTHLLRFAVDTGATRTAVGGHVLQLLGYAEPPEGERRVTRTGSGSVQSGVVVVSRLQAFGQVRTTFPVLWLPIPLGVMVDGLLGLDFFREQILKLDFVRGRASLCGKRWWQFWR